MLKLIYKAEASRRARVNEKKQKTKDVSAISESTYNSVSEASESKMPGGSSVRLLSRRSLKAATDEIDQIVRVGSISRPIVHHY